MIDLTVCEEALERAAARARQRNIIIPTFEQMRSPDRIPSSITDKLKNIGMWDVDPLNLFRITWHNEPVSFGGGFGPVPFIEFPKALSGVDARIVALIGKWFPTGAHKVGAAFGCLVPRLVTGQFDPTTQKAVWPSTGNYCRGGAYDSALLACESVAILPEGMSKERFDWLATVAGEVIKTPGTESNVKEIFDKCWELRRSGENLVIFNQFDEFGNYLWHYEITGPAMAEVLENIMGRDDKFRGVVLSTGSSGTIAAGDYLKERFPAGKIAAAEALQCPTLLMNGFGAHRIEGIGDKHVPWIHNVKNTDMVISIDDASTINLLRLFNEPAGKKYLVDQGVDSDLVQNLNLMGISGIGNFLSAIKVAKYYELGKNDVLITVLTDSMEMYQSRFQDLNRSLGEFKAADAIAAYCHDLLGTTVDYVEELTYPKRKRIHNLKYYTWVEQQGKSYEEIQAQWYDDSYWSNIHTCVEKLDRLIERFNRKAGYVPE